MARVSSQLTYEECLGIFEVYKAYCTGANEPLLESQQMKFFNTLRAVAEGRTRRTTYILLEAVRYLTNQHCWSFDTLVKASFAATKGCFEQYVHNYPITHQDKPSGNVVLAIKAALLILQDEGWLRLNSNDDNKWDSVPHRFDVQYPAVYEPAVRYDIEDWYAFYRKLVRAAFQIPENCLF